jgi:citrate lyase subunit beta/citryl-CoA lyase
MEPYRSLLFVPGHKPDWVAKAVKAGVDAVILDLEDSVPEAAKAEARTFVASSIDSLQGEHPHIGVLVRPNPLDTSHFGRDIRAVVRPGLDALLLPKVFGRDDIVAFDALLNAAEIEAGVQRGSVELVPTLETARSIAACDELASSPRVASLMSAAARDADVSREIGFTWTALGLETLYIRSRAVLACRAAGLTHPLCGLWQELSDLIGLREFARANAGLGFGGQVIIHPSHAGPVNEEYTPTAAVVERFRKMIDAFEAAQVAGSAAASFQGEHIDIAHVKTARQVVAFADRINDKERS